MMYESDLSLPKDEMLQQYHLSVFWSLASKSVKTKITVSFVSSIHFNSSIMSVKLKLG